MPVRQHRRDRLRPVRQRRQFDLERLHLVGQAAAEVLELHEVVELGALLGDAGDERGRVGLGGRAVGVHRGGARVREAVAGGHGAGEGREDWWVRCRGADCEMRFSRGEFARVGGGALLEGASWVGGMWT